MIPIRRSEIVLRPNNSRVLFRPFQPRDPLRILKIIGRAMELGEADVKSLLEQVLAEFHGRHQRLLEFFLKRFDAVHHHLLTDHPLSTERKLLIGSYFTQEYTLESAALFNPSLVWRPGETTAEDGSRRFIMSLRATGEGHLSSIAFRGGRIHADGQVSLDAPTGYVTAPEVVPNSNYEKALFQAKLVELGVNGPFVDDVLAGVDDLFTIGDLDRSIQFTLRRNRARRQEWDPAAQAMLALAKANYEIDCHEKSDVSERIVFPYSPTETNGIEDARFVEFTEDNGDRRYYATYTAFDGSVTFPQLVETSDFCRFRISTLNGQEVRDKGMALFPRKINGQYVMLSRQDGENIFLMYSEMLHFWSSKQLLLKPTFPWEFVQLGNCGSPIETEAGWLVLTHGVGPMRKYAIGAVLLDLNDPSLVIGRLSEPLIAPSENERAGYVPNVVYSCGSLVHNGRLILPYAMADFATTFATFALSDILSAMKSEAPLAPTSESVPA